MVSATKLVGNAFDGALHGSPINSIVIFPYLIELELICRSYVVKLGKIIGIGIEVLVFGPVLVLVLVLTLRHSRVLVLILSIDLGQMGVLVLVLGIGLSQIGVLVLVLSIGLSQFLVLVLVLRYEYWYCWCLV